MALENVKEKYARYIPKDNGFYKRYYHYFLYGIMLALVVIFGLGSIILIQISHRPLPSFTAVQFNNKQKMLLSAYTEPNLLPETIIRWAAMAATTAYSFDFVNYQKQVNAARPYFTDKGWQEYLASVNPLLSTIVQNQLFVTSVVRNKPVISNQGNLPDLGYTWRIQVPFLVSYQSANTASKKSYTVLLTIVQVPTNINPQGIGIDQFVMV